MSKLFIDLLLKTIAVFVAAYLLSGVYIESVLIAFLTAVVLAVLNVFVKPFLVFLTIPVTVLTLGLFLLIINAVIVLIAGYLVPGFEIVNFWWALLFGIIVSIIVSTFNYMMQQANMKN